MRAAPTRPDLQAALMHSMCRIVFAIVLAAAFAFSVRTARAAQPPFPVQAVDEAACERMKTRHVLSPGAPVRCDRLSIVRFRYVGFDARDHDDGEAVVMSAAADHVRAIFAALYTLRFPISRARLIDAYGGDDAASMRDNNTSAFNDRPVTGGGPPSLHAYGLAIDLNPVQNPYVGFEQSGQAVYAPPEGRRYANRRLRNPARRGMAEAVVRVFAEHGFVIWGGNWHAPVDYQHFQVPRELAQALSVLPPEAAKKIYADYVKAVRKCLPGNSSALPFRLPPPCLRQAVIAARM